MVVDEHALGYYLAELTTQSQYVAIAAEHLNAPFEPRPGPAPEPGLTRSFAAIQSLLAAAALVSKLMWSTGGSTARQRARRIRQELGVRDGDFPRLRDRAVRDSLEHVDERIDGYVAGRRPPLDAQTVDAGGATTWHGGPCAFGASTRLEEWSRSWDAKEPSTRSISII